MSTPRHLTAAELEAGLAAIRESPRDVGTLAMIVRRPSEGEREVIAEGELDLTVGLVGDNWKTRGHPHRADGSAHPDTQINIMNARAADLVAAGVRERWPLAGDQLYVDLDLAEENLPPGSRLAIGDAVLEITAEPHLGCKKFVARFGFEAGKFVNSKIGKQLHLRGLNAKVVKAGRIRSGDRVAKQANT